MSPSANQAAASSSSSSNPICLYCCVRRGGALPAAALEGDGVDGHHALLLHPHGDDLAAVVSEVDREEFTGEGSEARMQNPDWLIPRAMRHERIIEQVAEHAGAAVLPVRFGTLFSSLGPLDDLLEEHGGIIRAFLDRVQGKEEWSVKGYLDRGKAQEKVVKGALATAASADPSASPGKRYMQERRLRAQADQELERWLDEATARIAEELSQRSVERAERKLIASSDAPGEMVVNWAFLVPTEAVAEFREVVGRNGRERAEWGMSFQCAGPFPPFSFTPALTTTTAGERGLSP